MKYCVICGQTQRQPGLTNYTYSAGDQVVVVKRTPADICQNCGEVYFDEDTALRLDRLVAGALAAGSEVAIFEFEPPIAA